MPVKKIKRLVVGRIVRPHGIAGEVKVQLSSEYEGALDASHVKTVFLNGADPAVAVKRCRVTPEGLLLSLDGVPDRNAAELQRGKSIALDVKSLPRLPEGEYYAHDLVGMRVKTLDGIDLGELVEVLATGSNDVYVVHDAAGKETLLPAIESCVKMIDFDAETVSVVVPEGM
jgi:16S rRNA processing protein RimM